jgi:hypothetical protein
LEEFSAYHLGNIQERTGDGVGLDDKDHNADDDVLCRWLGGLKQLYEDRNKKRSRWEGRGTYEVRHGGCNEDI